MGDKESSRISLFDWIHGNEMNGSKRIVIQMEMISFNL